MKDKLIEIINSRLQGVAIDKDYANWLRKWLFDDMLEFGHYVAEEQKKQCANTGLHNKYSEQWILNSKNVCEQ